MEREREKTALMSDIAKAAVVVVNLDRDEVMFGGSFTDDGIGLDPLAYCETFWLSIADDWPGWEPSYVANAAAEQLARDRRLWQAGIADERNLMAARIEAFNAERAEERS